MRQIELIEKRKPREKHFLQEDGTIIAKIYNEDIHYMKNGKYEEIDNTLVENENYYINSKNSYKVQFGKTRKEKLCKIENSGFYLDFDIKEKEDYKIITKKTKTKGKLKFQDILKNIDVDYEINSNQIKESIILNDINSIVSKIEFDINTNLYLSINDDGSISSSDGENEIFKIEAPYMIDANNRISKNVSYNLKKFFNKYNLELIIDVEWLQNENRKYPVIIDPTITNTINSTSVQDTYICSETPTVNYNARDYMLIGAELYDGNLTPTVYRGLIRFDLPTIATGSEIIDARLNLVGYPKENVYYPMDKRLIEIHKINSSWTESNATWNSMNDKFDDRIETCFYGGGSSFDTNDDVLWEHHYANITNLVKQWYIDTENYGIMLKTSDETANDSDNTFTPKFVTNANIISGDNPQPKLEITYRNQNGIENYLEYFTQDFSIGKIKVNSYNGNLVGLFNVGAFRTGKFPLALNIVYNTNDVVLNYNKGYGLGWRLNLAQTIEYDQTLNCLIYEDADGTKHYFHNDDEQNINSNTNLYYDEDGLDLKIENFDNKYELIDKDQTILEFTKQQDNIAVLTKILDNEGYYINIVYNDGKIVQIIDSYNRNISLSYDTDKIIVTSPDGIVTLKYSNNLLSTILYGESEYLNLPLYFDYSTNNLISGVQYNSYKRVTYEYYSKSPYKVKKICDSNGDYFTISYNYSSTTITDNLGRVNTLTFNTGGNINSISNLKSKDFVKTALGKMNNFGEYYGSKNKLLSLGELIGYINNLLSNTSFEENNNIFTAGIGASSSITNEFSLSGEKSLKVSCTQVDGYIYKNLNVIKGNMYTFSAYVKNNTNSKIKLILEYLDSNGLNVENKFVIDNINEDFKRYDVTINYPSNASSELTIKISSENVCDFYIDDIQLEEGAIANPYNYIDNSDFSNGTTGWNIEASQWEGEEKVDLPNKFEIETLNDGSKALKIKMGLLYSTSISRSFPISGHEGDNYTISFWYKNRGTNISEDLAYNCCVINFEYEYGQGSIPSINLNPNTEEWQFFTYTFYAEHDYSSIYMSIFQAMDANELYITNISLLKNIKKTQFNYDDNGNILAMKSLSEEITSYNYDTNNKLVNMVDTAGNNYSMEYDEIYSNRILSGISNMGISNEIRYNELDTPKSTFLSNKIVDEIFEGVFNIRIAGTNKYLNFINRSLEITQIDGSVCRWQMESLILSNNVYYKIKNPIINDGYICNINSLAALDEYNESNSLFEIIKNQNGTFSFKLYNSNQYMLFENNKLMFKEYDVNNEKLYQFYIEKTKDYTFIENTGTYLDSGLAIESIIDSNFNKTIYDYDVNSGKLQSITNAKGVKTNYTYDSLTKDLVGIFSNYRTIAFIYNDYGLISTINYIVQGRIIKSYFYRYDNSNRLIGVRVGNMDMAFPLFTKTYDEITGDLKSVEYENSSKIEYEYDNMNRISLIKTDDDNYYIYYYKNGKIGKVLSSNDEYKYIYDDASRIKEYKFNNFITKYRYNQNDLIENLSFNLDDNIFDINYIYGKDDLISTISNSGGTNEYVYDNLGRILKIKYNNSIITEYEYIKNGLRDTKLIKSIKNTTDKYSYKYDELNNITQIYHNDKLEKRFSYDAFNQLIREDNLELNLTIKYNYDDSGNIKSKKTYKLNTYDLIESNKFRYYDTYNPDVLMSVDGTSISYDGIYNPDSIGDNIKLTWKNKNQLVTYEDTTKNLIINYKYDKNNQRLSKSINGEFTYYYWNDNKLIIEKTNNNVIYYIYDSLNNLLGFEYNGTRYNYIKNGMQEIVGILDNNNNIVARYGYDSWGRILYIVDNNNDDISQLSNHIANINPIRYKSYYYDKETELYYLKSRYYNPKWCRFINPDSTINNDIFGTNPYLYCSNNPVIRRDNNGNWWIFASAVRGAVIGVVCNTISNVAQGKEWDEGFWGSLAAGAVGGITGGVLGSIASSLVGSIIDETSSYIDVEISRNKKSKTPISIDVKKKKEFNSANISESISNVTSNLVVDVLTDGIIEASGFSLGDSLVYVNDNWFKPKKFMSSFFGKYATKKTLNELIDSGVSESVNYLLTPVEEKVMPAPLDGQNPLLDQL